MLAHAIGVGRVGGGGGGGAGPPNNLRGEGQHTFSTNLFLQFLCETGNSQRVGGGGGGGGAGPPII